MINFIKSLITISIIVIFGYVLIIYFIAILPYAILIGIVIIILANIFNKKND